MKIAKQTEHGLVINDHIELFPDTSFPSTGPTDSFLEEIGMYRVSSHKQHDVLINKLVETEPYIENGVVYDVTVELLTPDDLERRQQIHDITPRQIRHALNRKGWRGMVESAVSQGSQDLKDWWEFSTIYERNHPLVDSMGQNLGLSSQDIDDLWILASTLQGKS
jgi:hypothetical protein